MQIRCMAPNRSLVRFGPLTRTIRDAGLGSHSHAEAQESFDALKPCKRHCCDALAMWRKGTLSQDDDDDIAICEVRRPELRRLDCSSLSSSERNQHRWVVQGIQETTADGASKLFGGTAAPLSLLMRDTVHTNVLASVWSSGVAVLLRSKLQQLQYSRERLEVKHLSPTLHV